MKVACGQTGGCLFPRIFRDWPGNVIFDRANAHGFPSLRRAIPQLAASLAGSDRQSRVRQWCKLLDLRPHRRLSLSVFYFLLAPFLMPFSGCMIAIARSPPHRRQDHQSNGAPVHPERKLSIRWDPSSAACLGSAPLSWQAWMVSETAL